MSLVKTVIDFETAYGKHPETQENITLSKLTGEEYVRHPLFKVHGIGVKIDSEPTFYVYGQDMLHFLKTHPWDHSYVICHHAHFDGAILSWRAGIRPAFWGCTLSMARALFPHESASLANVSKLLGLGEKGKELVHFIHKWGLTEQDQMVMGGYCRNDVDLTAAAFDCMVKHFPASELRLIDLTIRQYTEPVLDVDRSVLLEEFVREKRTKRALLKKCNTDKKILASNQQFAELLLSLGVDPPKKLSPSKVKDGRVDPDNAGEPPRGILPAFKAVGTPEERAQIKEEKRVYPWAYAFGKGDEEFKLLLDHPDPQIQAVVEARMGVKSTIKETRSKRFFKIGTRGTFPVYLTYYGARTGRFCLSGDTEIIVLREGSVCYILLPELRLSDLVWDGEDFVEHEGLIRRGRQEVITYDGITGTPNHRVFVEGSEETTSLQEAAAQGLTIKIARFPQGHKTFSGHSTERSLQSKR